MELKLDHALQKGVEAHKAGRVQEADRYYTAILKANPKHPDANHNMGVLAVGVGKINEALPFFKTALEVNPKIDQFWLSYIDALIKLERITDAKAVFDQAKSKGVNGNRFYRLEKSLAGLYKSIEVNATSQNSPEPPNDQLQNLLKLYTQSQYQKALMQASQLLEEFPRSVNLCNIIGAANKGLGKLDEAIDAYNKALSIKPKNAEVYSNMGVALKDLGKLEEAIDAYNKALSIKPNYAEVYSNMGVALKDLGKLEEAIEVYTKALSVKPDYAEVHFNIGNALKEQGKLEEAIKAYNKALSIKPNYAEAHLNLSSIKKYKEDDDQIVQVKEFYKQGDLSEDAKCYLSFALAKMYEDIGKLDRSFAVLTRGNSLRKQILNYSIDQDINLFTKLKTAQPCLLQNSLDIKEGSIETLPVFILGMPRSGTTLVEQIISSHSEVFGAGELKYVTKFGKELVVDATFINTIAISEFRESYLSDLSKISNGKRFVTDKMPQNFRFIPLICATFPEAKIVHVQRDAAAICWSNYKHYFGAKDLGYSFDLRDVVLYYEQYIDLMKQWQSEYGERIYQLNYESLTTDQENQTRKLIEHLGLNWEEACLSPQRNKRSVRTGSQQQVRQKVYKGSSEEWRKYEPYLNGAFDSLPSS